MYAEVYGKHKFIQIIFFDMKTAVCQIMENSLIRGFPKFEPFCCVFSIICYKMKIGSIIRGGGVYLSKIIFHTFCHIDNTAAERYDQ